MNNFVKEKKISALCKTLPINVRTSRKRRHSSALGIKCPATPLWYIPEGRHRLLWIERKVSTFISLELNGYFSVWLYQIVSVFIHQYCRNFENVWGCLCKLVICYDVQSGAENAVPYLDVYKNKRIPFFSKLINVPHFR